MWRGGGAGRTWAARARSLRWRCGDAGLLVVGVDDGLRDVGGRERPEHVRGLRGDVEQDGVAVGLGVGLHGGGDLLGDLAEGFLPLGVVGGLGVFGVAVQLLFLGVDGAKAGGPLLIGEGCGSSLEAFLHGVDFGCELLEVSAPGLVLLLGGEGDLLSFVRGEDNLLEVDERDLGIDGGGSGCGCGGAGRRGGGGSSLSEGERRRDEARGERGQKSEVTVHADCLAPWFGKACQVWRTCLDGKPHWVEEHDE